MCVYVCVCVCFVYVCEREKESEKASERKKVCAREREKKSVCERERVSERSDLLISCNQVGIEASYLTARPITMADKTRQFLASLGRQQQVREMKGERASESGRESERERVCVFMCERERTSVCAREEERVSERATRRVNSWRRSAASSR